MPIFSGAPWAYARCASEGTAIAAAVPQPKARRDIVIVVSLEGECRDGGRLAPGVPRGTDRFRIGRTRHAAPRDGSATIGRGTASPYEGIPAARLRWEHGRRTSGARSQGRA